MTTKELKQTIDYFKFFRKLDALEKMAKKSNGMHLPDKKDYQIFKALVKML